MVPGGRSFIYSVGPLRHRASVTCPQARRSGCFVSRKRNALLPRLLGVGGLDWPNQMVHTPPNMKRVIALQGCLALLCAFFLAPYQHVHEGQCDGHGSDGFFDNSTVVHAHPFLFSHVHADVFLVSHKSDDRTSVGESSEEHASWWLNNSSLVLHAVLPAVILPSSPLVPATTAISFCTIAFSDQRGHDPPPLDCSASRAPPA